MESCAKQESLTLGSTLGKLSPWEGLGSACTEMGLAAGEDHRQEHLSLSFF